MKEKNPKLLRISILWSILIICYFGSYAAHEKVTVNGESGILEVELKGQQQKSVSGKVTDSSGSQLPGVSVVVKGRTTGTVTDVNGNFSISGVKESDVLVFSFIGMKPQEINIEGKSNVSVVLLEDNQGIEEVVVVGYGTQKKANLTGAVSTLDTRDLQNRPITQTSQALQGKLAGVTVTQNFGLPGSDGSTIRIRGIGTLGSKDPMVLIDGIEGSINDINPNDIQNISVLKDAASASIYGSRAANGVILIVTKRGTNREAMNVTYNGMIGSQLPDALPELVNGADYMMMKNENERNLGRPNLYSEAYINDYKSKVGTEPYFDTNWFGAAMKERSMEHQHTLTVRGGTEKIASMVSLSYLDQDALIEKTDFLRSGIRFNTNFQASKRLGFIMDGFVRMEETTRPSFVGGSGNGLTEMFRMMAEIPAIFPAMWSDGTIGEGWQGNNPLGYINYGGQYKAYSSRILFNLRANYEIAKWLNLEVAYSPKYLSVNSKSMKNIYTYKRIDGSTGVRPTGRNGLNNSHSRSRENFYQSLIRYQKSYGKHATSALLGFEAVDYRNDNFWASRENYTLPEYEVLDTGDGNFKDNGGSASEWALSSFFSRINYAFSEKYLVEANLRYDGSSRFARENRWGWFPSFSLGWRVKEENFLKNVNDISNLKLRFSWGQLGNQNIGNYPYLGVVSINQPYYFGKAVVQGAAQTVLPNRNVTWETTLVLNGGIDFGFFNNRLSGSLDVYKKNTFDILYTRDIPAIIGLSASEQNIAEVQNVGWDLQLSWEDNISDFRYGADLVLSDVRNKVLNLNGKPQYGRNVVFEDEEYQAFYGYECIGIYRSPEDLAKYPALNTTVKIGDLIYRDQNDDKLINPADDKKIIGSSIPRFNYGLTLSCAYKSFDFSVFLQGVGKKDLYYSRGADAAYGGNYYKHELGRLVPDDPTTYTTATWIKMGGALANNEDNSFYLYDAKYLRFKNIVLGYTLPPSILRFVGLSGLRVYATGQNLFTLDKLSIKSVDPEAPSTSSGPSYYPNTKTLALGVDIKF